MKTRMFLMLCLLVMGLQSHSQGLFWAHNNTAPTRMWSIDGPLAGHGIWGQMFAGPAPDNLNAIAVPREHTTNGTVHFGVIAVPGVPALNLAYVQMVAWDGRLWGTNLTDVPADQLGRTDTVPVFLSYYWQPQLRPPFTQPAIVPVPEPSVLALALLAGAALVVRRRLRHRARHPE